MRRFVLIAAAALLLAGVPVLAGPDEAPAGKAGGMTVPADASTVTLKDTGGKLVLELGGEWSSLPEPARRMVLETLKERLSDAQLKHALKKLVAGERKIELPVEKRLATATREKVIATLKEEVRPDFEEEIEIEVEQCGPMIEDEKAKITVELKRNAGEKPVRVKLLDSDVCGDKPCKSCSGECGCGTADDVVDKAELQKSIEEARSRLKKMMALEGAINEKVIRLAPGKGPQERIVISGGRGELQILTTDKEGRFRLEGVPHTEKHVIRAKTDRDGEVRIYGRDGKEIGVEGDRLKTIRGRIVGEVRVEGDRLKTIRGPIVGEVRKDGLLILRAAPGEPGEPGHHRTLERKVGAFLPKDRAHAKTRVKLDEKPKVMVLGDGSWEKLKEALKSFHTAPHSMAAPRWPVWTDRPMPRRGHAVRRPGMRRPGHAAPRGGQDHDGQGALIRALNALRQEIQGLRAEVRGMRGVHGGLKTPPQNVYRVHSGKVTAVPKPPVPPAPPRAMIRMAPGAQPKAVKMAPGVKLHVTPKVQSDPRVALVVPPKVTYGGMVVAPGQMEAKLKKLYAQVTEQKAMIQLLMKRLEVLEKKLSK